MKRYRIEAFVKTDSYDEDEIEDLLLSVLEGAGMTPDGVAAYEVLL